MDNYQLEKGHKDELTSLGFNVLNSSPGRGNVHLAKRATIVAPLSVASEQVARVMPSTEKSREPFEHRKMGADPLVGMVEKRVLFAVGTVVPSVRFKQEIASVLRSPDFSMEFIIQVDAGHFVTTVRIREHEVVRLLAPFS